MTGNEKMDDAAKMLLGELVCGMVSREITLGQAVRRVDEFADNFKGKLPEEKRLAAKAALLQCVFSVHERQDTSQPSYYNTLPYGPPLEPPLPLWKQKGLKFYDDDDFGVAGKVWCYIRDNLLPAHMVDTEEKRIANARRVSWFVGLYGAEFAIRWLRRFNGKFDD
jgi:hypothetical protein